MNSGVAIEKMPGNSTARCNPRVGCARRRKTPLNYRYRDRPIPESQLHLDEPERPETTLAHCTMS